MAWFFDSVANPTTAGTTDLSWTHTIIGALGTTGLISVVVGAENGSNNITGATFNSVAMTERVSDGNSGGNGWFGKIYELIGSNVPAAGAYTVTATFSGFDGSANSRAAGSMAFGGIKNQVAEATASINANGTSPLAQSITTLTANALVIVGYGNQNAGAPTFSTGETTAFSAIPASGEQSITVGAYKNATTAGSNNSSLTVSNPEAEAMLLASYAPNPSNGNFFMLF